MRNLFSFLFSFSFTSEVHLPSVFYFISPFFPLFLSFFSLTGFFSGLLADVRACAGSCSYLRARGVEGGKKREFLGATVDLTPEKNRATLERVDPRGLTDFSVPDSEIGEPDSRLKA